MNNLCKHCEYGNRFIDLGQCPECSTGRIVGDLHTRNIFCSNLHYITAVAVDFCGKQNCCDEVIFRNYEVIIVSDLSHKQLISIGKYIEKSPVQVYKAIKNSSSFFEQVDFYKLLKIGRYLYENNISFHIEPELSVLYNFTVCFPDLADDYQWVFELYRHKKKI